MNTSTFGIVAGMFVILGAARLLFFTGDESVAPTSTPDLSSGEISADTFADFAAREDVTIIDVRTPEEIAEGKVAPDALELDFYDQAFVTRLAELDRNNTYAVYCRSGRRSGETIALMRELGFTSVFDLAGGEMAWRESGRTLVKGDNPDEPSDRDCTSSTC